MQLDYELKTRTPASIAEHVGIKALKHCCDDVEAERTRAKVAVAELRHTRPDSLAVLHVCAHDHLRAALRGCRRHHARQVGRAVRHRRSDVNCARDVLDNAVLCSRACRVRVWRHQPARHYAHELREMVARMASMRQALLDVLVARDGVLPVINATTTEIAVAADMRLGRLPDGVCIFAPLGLTEREVVRLGEENQITRAHRRLVPRTLPRNCVRVHKCNYVMKDRCSSINLFNSNLHSDIYLVGRPAGRNDIMAS